MTKKSKKPTKQLMLKDPAKEPGNLKMLGGSGSDEWNKMLADQAIQTLWAKPEGSELDEQLSATASGLAGINPKDELEGMMAAQLIAAHNAAMECYRRAMIPQQSFEGRRENLNQANKLSRTYASLLEALSRHRGKGQQKVTVEHVHVHAGGQAVVGMVETPGGVQPKTEDQPHAKQIAHAPQPEMQRENAERGPLPITSDEERPLPNARGQITGGSEGKPKCA
jgi:hypothetical protein